MVIAERMVDIAECDACGHLEYSDYHGNFVNSKGYTLVVTDHETMTTHEAVACKDTHIGKAARAVLDKWRAEGADALRVDSGGRLPASTVLVDAPPLPERDDDTSGGAQ